MASASKIKALFDLFGPLANTKLKRMLLLVLLAYCINYFIQKRFTKSTAIKTTPPSPVRSQPPPPPPSPVRSQPPPPPPSQANIYDEKEEKEASATEEKEDILISEQMLTISSCGYHAINGEFIWFSHDSKWCFFTKEKDKHFCLENNFSALKVYDALQSKNIVFEWDLSVKRCWILSDIDGKQIYYAAPQLNDESMPTNKDWICINGASPTPQISVNRFRYQSIENERKYNDKLHALIEENERINTKLQKQRKQNDEFRAKLNVFHFKNEELLNKYNSNMNELFAQKHKYEAIAKELREKSEKEYKKRNDELMSKINKSNLRNEELSNKISESAAELSKIKGEYMQLLNKCNECTKYNQSIQRKNNQLIKEKNKMKNKFQTMNNELTTKVNKIESVLKKKIKEKEKENQHLLEKYDNENKHLLNKHRRQLSKSHQNEQSLKDVHKQEIKGKNRQLLNKYNEYQNMIDRLNTEMDELKKEHNRLLEKCSKLETESDELNHQCNIYANELQNYHNDIDEIHQLKEEEATVKNKEIRMLSKQIEELEDKLSESLKAGSTTSQSQDFRFNSEDLEDSKDTESIPELSRNGTGSSSVWVNDKGITACTQCRNTFKKLYRRKHHCRACGYIFCDTCSKNKIQLIGFSKAVRVCDDCYQIQASKESIKTSKSEVESSSPLYEH